MRARANQDREPWVLVAGSFHRRGGMDKLNAALASYLLDDGHVVHLVAHEVEPLLQTHPRAVVWSVPRPASSYLLGEFLLAKRGREIAGEVRKRWNKARVVVNGGNCAFGDVNWVHTVHHQWPCRDAEAPLSFRIRNRLAKMWAKRQERRCINLARIVVANSERTRQHLLQQFSGLDPNRVCTVPLGADQEFVPVTPGERQQAREAFGLARDERLVVFVGALGHDTNKGLDTVLDAWERLVAVPGWNTKLAIAGSGSGVNRYRARIAQKGLQGGVSFLGQTDQVPQLLAGADLLVSPVRYEAYGMNAHEAICRGVPVMISANAGFAERMGAAMAPMLLQDPTDARELQTKLVCWRQTPDVWCSHAKQLADELRNHSSRRMAEQIVRLVQGSS
ncbi:hypothetical protein F183_A28870 [Bryobacterales bacterium F-183]|nr:hypothetical protein F183_A28870 [Bryobacterales bacterium F-183]